MIAHSRPSIGAEEAEAVRRVVASGMLAEGPEVAALEHSLAALWQVPCACALAHGTAALHLGLLALGAAPGKQVLLPSYGCVSLLNAVAYTGAAPVLVDNLEGHFAPDLNDLRRRLDSQVAAALLPHLFGRRLELGDLPGEVAVLEDSTHSVGLAGLQGRATLASFFATKMLASGEGGVFLTNDPKLDEFVRDHRSYDEKESWWPRYNYKMTDMAAALLRVQVGKLPQFLARRRAIAQRYAQHWRQHERLRLPPSTDDDVHYRFVAAAQVPLQPLLDRLRARGVGARRPVYRPLHRYLNLPDRDYPQATHWFEQCLSLPLYPALSDQEVERVIEVVDEELARA